ncbi:MAG: adenylate kinase [Candidatus Bathyarchaeia archaeon]
MTKIITLTGIPGVGKTTICDRLVEEAKLRGAGVDIVNFGTVMLEVMKAKYPQTDRDSIRRLPVDVQRHLQKEAAERIVGKAVGTQYLIIDTHTIIRTEQGFLPGLPLHVLTVVNPSLIVLVEALPKEIMRRRTSDLSRRREMMREEEILEELRLSRMAAMNCSVAIGVPIKIVENREGKQAEVAKEIINVCEEI